MTLGVALKKKPSVSDPNESQRRAADPQRSVWVAASAGAGKTKVLTDRVLRLLLPREDGSAGTAPHRILCLTFTKAAASEMRLRLSARLSKWAVIKDAALNGELHELFGRAPTDEERNAARRLFAAVTDAPGGLNIMTIHAFCQSVLGRFPLEAGLPPHFEPLEEAAAAALLTRARNDVMATARQMPDTPVGRALPVVAAAMGEDRFDQLVNGIVNESRQFAELLDKHNGMNGLARAVHETLSLAPDEDEDTVLRAACRDNMFDERGLREACRVMSECGTDAGDRPAGLDIQKWLDVPLDRRALLWDKYLSRFLTTDGSVRKKLATKKPQEAFPQILSILEAEAERILKAEDRRKAARCAALTRALLLLGDEVRRRYGELKTARAALDFNDLIDRTLTLLERRGMAGWVMFKLDGGLDHILIDEAQDTNPEQWRIIAALCDDFFSGRGARADASRTVFAVGDEKQSIYSFQRAAPEKFRAMRTFFSERIQAAKQQLTQEDMNISFRSVPAVLKVVDSVFAADDVRAGLGPLPLRHESFRAGHAGLVELWPLFTTPEREERDAWAPPVTVRPAQGGGARLAEHIGATVKNWIDSGEILPARGRAIQPGDIMILVRRRSAFVGQLIRALKTRSIPVGGADRMILKEQLAVQDLIAAAQFALLPSDDLSLACLLKSPLIGWSDEVLENIAWKRPSTLWQEVQNDANRDIVNFLRNLIAFARNDGRPYEFFSTLLHSPCPADTASGIHAMTARLGTEAVDPLEEFLSAALDFENGNIATLQGFLLAFGQSDSQIKREQEEAGGHIRIMTVHGAKGLQAPIVILPDTVRTTRTPPSNAGQRLIWPDKSGLSVPLWSPRKDTDCRQYAATLAALDEKQDEEYRRLLYVALTRAEDRLYVCGHTGRKGAIPESWHHYVAHALAALSETTRLPCTAAGMEKEPTLRFEEMQTVATAEKSGKRISAVQSPAANNLDWSCLHSTAPLETAPQKTRNPSRSSQSDGTNSQPAALSPLAGADTYRFRRGIVTHRLLQHLPDIPASDRAGAASSFIARHAADLPEEIRAGIVKETLAVLENPAFAPLFGPGSMAEVPVCGLVDDAAVSGQIDRLLVTDTEIWIADYKTNRPPPADESGIPAAYRYQMKSYSDIVSKIYNNRRVRCFLLWTDGPRMMEIA